MEILDRFRRADTLQCLRLSWWQLLHLRSFLILTINTREQQTRQISLGVLMQLMSHLLNSLIVVLSQLLLDALVLKIGVLRWLAIAIQHSTRLIFLAHVL